MILQALNDLYDSLEHRGEIAQYGYGMAKISFAVVLDDQGAFIDLLPLRETVTRGKKSVEMPKTMEVFSQESRTVGIKPNFLCDNAAYIFGIDAQQSPRSLQCFTASAAYHMQMLKGLDTPAAQVVCKYFATWDPSVARQHKLIQEYEKDIIGSNLVFRYNGNFVHHNKAIRSLWEQGLFSKTDAVTGQCLVTGQQSSIVRIHTLIKGVRDAQSSGASLISYNAAAFESYGKSQSYNAPISDSAVFAYTTALNKLLSDSEHVQILGDTTTVFWAENAEPLYADIFTSGVNPTPGIDNSTLTRAMRELAMGHPFELNGKSLYSDMKFCILGLSPNAARISVRFFYMNTFDAFCQRLMQHQERLEIIRPVYDQLEYLSVNQLLFETVNKKSKDKKVSPVLAGSLLHAILNDTPYPAALYQGVMIRVRADKDINRRRAAIIKAYLLKSQTNIEMKEVLTVELNEQSRNIPYVLGRLFSILENIQQASSPGINATIKDRYFNSASSTPAVIFPILLRLKNNHMRVISRDKKNLAVYYEKQIGSLLECLQQQLPNHLTLDEQGTFILGYYHQTQSRYKSKEENNNG